MDRTAIAVSDDTYLAAVESLIPLGRKLGRTFAHRWGGDADDMFSDAMVGAMQAVKRFDPSRGVPLHHFAGPRMTGEIVDQVRQLSWRPRDSRNQAVGPLQRQVQLSLDGLLWPRGDEAPIQLFDLAADIAMEDLELRLTIVDLLAGLPDRWAFVLGEQLLRGQTLHAVAGTLGVTASRVCQINKVACAAMRKGLLSELVMESGSAIPARLG